MANLMSRRFRIATTTVLGSWKGFGPGFSIAAVQLSNMAQKTNEEGALTRSVRLGYHLAILHDLVICRCCKKIIPNRLAKLVLVSQASDLTRNFGKIQENIGYMK